MRLVCEEFFQAVEYLCTSWLPSRRFVREAFYSAHEIDQRGKILKLPEVIPWKDHLFDLEEEIRKEGSVLYVLFEDSVGDWKIMAVPESRNGFSSRKPLPWRGLRDQALCQASGIPDCIFVHNSGFIGGNKTESGALRMALRALENEE